jgi:PAS domain S-box-containing protein
MDHLMKFDRDDKRTKATTSAIERKYLYYQAAFDSSSCGHIMTDPDGIIMDVNRTAEKLLNVAEGSLAGEPVSTLLTQPVEWSGQEASQETSLKCGGHRAILVELTVAPMADYDGKPIGYHYTFHDITRPKRIEAERERLLTTLQHRSEYLETASEVSHAVSSILDPDALIQEVASLVKERFGLYYVGLFLVDQTGAWSNEPRKWAVLKAGTGDAGRRMMEEEHRLRIGDTSMIGWCIANQQPLIALDAQEERLRFHNPLLPHTQSELALPLISRGEAIGALTVQSEDKEAFSANDIAQLQTMADQVANAIANAQLFEKAQKEIEERQRIERTLRRHTQELALINQASRALTSTLDLDLVLITFLEEIRRLMGAVASSVWLKDPGGDDLVCRQATGPQNSVVRGWRLAEGEGLAGWVAQEKRSLIVSDAQTDPRHAKGVSQETGLPLRSILTIPLRTKQNVIGVLQVVDTEIDRFHTEDAKLLEPLASTAAIAVENAQLYEQARRDAATKSLLLREANHRVKNTLTSIVGLLYAEKRHAGVEEHPTYQLILTDLISRVQGMAAVHSMLAASEWKPLLLTELTSRIIHSVLHTLPKGKRITVSVCKSPARVTPDQARHLTLVINELTTNTVKHSLSQREQAHIDVRIASNGDRIRLTFRDNGPGYPDDVINLERYDVGFNLIQKIVQRNLEGDLLLYNDGGAVTQIGFRSQASEEGSE